MSELIGITTLKYKSETIIERRRRVLRETRNLIAETGYAAFNVRDLCARAGIAQKTLYNAFGSKENVIASAVREYLVEFNERTTYSFDEATIDGQLERIVKVQSENMRVAAYTKAIVAVFNSPIGDKFIRSAIRDLCEASARSCVEAIEQSNGLAKGVTAAWLSQFIVTTTFAVTTDWCAEEIPDDQFLDRAAETFLMVLASSTRGKANTHARRWLEDLRENRASWVSLRRLAEVRPPQPLDAARTAPSRRARRGAEDARSDAQTLVSAG